MWCHYGNCLNQCDAELPVMVQVALREGFDSIQFVGHCDMRCNLCANALEAPLPQLHLAHRAVLSSRRSERTRACRCGHELVLLGVPGTEACHAAIEYRRGWNASLPCACRPSATLSSERGQVIAADGC